MQPIHKELTSPNYGDLVYEFQDEESVAPWYVATRAVELFRTKHGRYPGEGKTEDQLENEFKLLKQECDELMKEAFPDDPIEMNNKYLKELVRFSDSKLHTVGAYLGGVASQEGIKMLIGQYTPLNHTMVYDGIHGRAQVFEI